MQQATYNLESTQPTGVAQELVSQLVELMLGDAVTRSVSDVHFEPTHSRIEVK